MAGVYAARGVDAWVFRGDDGLDELTTTTTSTLWAVHDGEVTTHSVDPASYGLAPATTEDLRGGDAAHNAEVVRRMLAGDRGPVRDAVVLNAGAALAVYDAPGAPVDEALAAGHRAGRCGDRLGRRAGRARPVGRGVLALGCCSAVEAAGDRVGVDHDQHGEDRRR